MIFSLASTLSDVGTQKKFEASCVLLGYHENSVGLPRVTLWARMSGVWASKRVHCARTARTHQHPHTTMRHALHRHDVDGWARYVRARTNCGRAYAKRGRTRKERQQPPTQRVEGDAVTDLARWFIALL